MPVIESKGIAGQEPSHYGFQRDTNPVLKSKWPNPSDNNTPIEQKALNCEAASVQQLAVSVILLYGH